eukprot:TRINITY_DN13827_c1_g1_i1.p2 TRINITY_DN13827_c1_g1~~TRINITY_DN13827_c1_g1_i1.p2  ORF type:complete len:300 (+),score=-42.52 TRINITY_DN13827_c1_g1_i1:3-902(+)
MLIHLLTKDICMHIHNIILYNICMYIHNIYTYIVQTCLYIYQQKIYACIYIILYCIIYACIYITFTRILYKHAYTFTNTKNPITIIRKQKFQFVYLFFGFRAWYEYYHQYFHKAFTRYIIWCSQIVNQFSITNNKCLQLTKIQKEHPQLICYSQNQMLLIYLNKNQLPKSDCKIVKNTVALKIHMYILLNKKAILSFKNSSQHLFINTHQLICDYLINTLYPTLYAQHEESCQEGVHSMGFYGKTFLKNPKDPDKFKILVWEKSSPIPSFFCIYYFRVTDNRNNYRQISRRQSDMYFTR